MRAYGTAPHLGPTQPLPVLGSGASRGKWRPPPLYPPAASLDFASVFVEHGAGERGVRHCGRSGTYATLIPGCASVRLKVPTALSDKNAGALKSSNRNSPQPVRTLHGTEVRTHPQDSNPKLVRCPGRYHRLRTGHRGNHRITESPSSAPPVSFC